MQPVKYCLDMETQRLSVSNVRHLVKNVGIGPCQTSPRYEFIDSLREKHAYFTSSTQFLKQVILFNDFWPCIIVQTFSNHQLNAQFFYFSTICMLHYAPQHVSSSTLLILRGTNCITTPSGIVILCKQPYSMQVESGLHSALHPHTVRLLTEGDDTRGCGDTIGPPEDEQRAARNMLRSIV